MLERSLCAGFHACAPRITLAARESNPLLPLVVGATEPWRMQTQRLLVAREHDLAS
jgi:hypothetical protein